jgi:hypothetical protein
MNMELGFLFQQLGIALGLRLLVGLQRESVASRLAELRTFPLVTLFGSICTLLAMMFGGWVIVAGLIGLAALIFVAVFGSPMSVFAVILVRDPAISTNCAIAWVVRASVPQES